MLEMQSFIETPDERIYSRDLSLVCIEEPIMVV